MTETVCLSWNDGTVSLSWMPVLDDGGSLPLSWMTEAVCLSWMPVLDDLPVLDACLPVLDACLE